MITYKGHYEVTVTNYYGQTEAHYIRIETKPSWFKRLCAKLAGFTWEDKEITMSPPAPRKPARKKSTATV